MEIVNSRPLYIAAQDPVLITLDGPALRLKQEHKALRWYPLVRVSRIIASNKTQWQAASITECLKRGIPIVFFTPNNGVTGWAVPSTIAPGSFASRLSELVTRPDWQSDIDNWHRAKERRAAISTLKRVKFRSSETRPSFLINQVLAHIDRGWSGVTLHRLMQLQPVVAGVIMVRLQAVHAPLEILAIPGTTSIVHRIWEILRWDLLQQLAKEQHQPWEQYNLHRAAEILESNSYNLGERVVQIISSLNIYLAQESVTCP
ncbi:MAG: CRISPR-associated endonuclease Cas1 [Granulosicoccus sp.]